MEKVLSLKNVSASYGKKMVLTDMSFDIPQGAITAVIGPSGGGKSTLLRCLNRMIEEEEGGVCYGDIFLQDKNIRDMTLNILQKKIGMVFQSPTPFPFSIYKNMTYALRYYGVRNKAVLQETVREKLQMAGLWDEIKDDLQKPALTLSGGQQQRLCIARALTAEPEVLLLDEPCSALDVKSTAAVEQMLLSLCGNLSIVLVTHNLAEARRIADWVLYIRDGRCVEFTEKEAFFAHPQTEDAAQFISGDFG